MQMTFQKAKDPNKPFVCPSEIARIFALWIRRHFRFASRKVLCHGVFFGAQDLHGEVRKKRVAARRLNGVGLVGLVGGSVAGLKGSQKGPFF